MKTLLSGLALVLALTLFTPVSVQAAPPSKESVQQLLKLMNADHLMKSAFDQMDVMMKSSLKQSTAGESLDAKQQAILAKQQTKMMAMIKEEFSWNRIQDSFVQIYRDTYSQKEVDGLIAFYQSPIGRAFVEKQPELMKHTMTMMQQRMGPVMQKIQQMTKETEQELKAADSGK